MSTAQRQITTCALLLAGALALLLTSTAHAATARRHHHKPLCKPPAVARHKTIHRHHRKVHVIVCVRPKPRHAPVTPAPSFGAPTPAPPPAVLHAHLDPTFTRDRKDPLHVAYSYSASALTTQEGVLVANPTLPEGVLSLYTDGLLKCSINVGGTITGGECPVHYEETGAHEVVVTYQSGTLSATETTVEQISPFATTTTLTIVYTPLEHAENQPYSEPQCVEYVTVKGQTKCARYTTESHVWKIGSLSITASTTDEYANSLNTGMVGPIVNSQIGTGNVYGCTTDEGPAAHELAGIAVGDTGEEASRKCTITPAEVETGKFTATGSYAGVPGWAASSVTQPVVFTPTITH